MAIERHRPDEIKVENLDLGKEESLLPFDPDRDIDEATWNEIPTIAQLINENPARDYGDFARNCALLGRPQEIPEEEVEYIQETIDRTRAEGNWGGLIHYGAILKMLGFESGISAEDLTKVLGEFKRMISGNFFVHGVSRFWADIQIFGVKLDISGEGWTGLRTIDGLGKEAIIQNFFFQEGTRRLLGKPTSITDEDWKRARKTIEFWRKRKGWVEFISLAADMYILSVPKVEYRDGKLILHKKLHEPLQKTPPVPERRFGN